MLVKNPKYFVYKNVQYDANIINEDLGIVLAAGGMTQGVGSFIGNQLVF